MNLGAIRMDCKSVADGVIENRDEVKCVYEAPEQTKTVQCMTSDGKAAMSVKFHRVVTCGW